MDEAFLPKGHMITKFALFCFCVAILATSAAIMSGLGSRWGWWHFRTGFVILKLSGYGSLIAAGLSLVGCIWSGLSGSRIGFALALVALLSSLTVAGTLWHWKQKAQASPKIHDITTDTVNPPTFKAILPLRKDAPNPSEYGGPEIAALQRSGYPGIGPAILPLSANDAFQEALSTAIKMGWQIVDANQAEGRIEATDTTFWFGFKDDIIIRVTPERTGSRIDVRSVSRVGLSDVGTNAGRIERFLKKVKK